jgi:hypothetical protein
MMKNCISKSMMKMKSTQRLVMKSPSDHRSCGIAMKPTSTGVTIAVKISEQVVAASQYASIVLLRGSMVV